MKNERKQRNLTKTAGKTCRRLLSGLLAAVMALYALPAGAVTFSDAGASPQTEFILPAEQTVAENSVAVDEAALQEQPPAQVLYEMPELRGSHSKQFRMSDGSFTMVSYANDVHYQERGTWKEIDNTLTASATASKTPRGMFALSFPTKRISCLG